MRRAKVVKTMTKVVILSFVHIDVFTLTCLIFNAFGLTVQESIITGFFSIFTGELAGMLLKKLLDKAFEKKKSRKDQKEIEEENEDAGL